MSEYNSVAKTFSKSREMMRWEEVGYFFSLEKNNKICDLGSGSGRLISHYYEYFGEYPDEYIGIDLSQELIKEAEKSFPNFTFQHGNISNIDNILEKSSQDSIYLIASFHHLGSIDDRIKCLKGLYKVLQKGGKIHMTNWALKSGAQKERYKNSYIEGSENEYGSCDFSIKIGNTQRFYHCFTLSELGFLAEKSGFTVLENRLFDTEKNIVTILQK